MWVFAGTLAWKLLTAAYDAAFAGVVVLTMLIVALGSTWKPPRLMLMMRCLQDHDAGDVDTVAANARDAVLIGVSEHKPSWRMLLMRCSQGSHVQKVAWC